MASSSLIRVSRAIMAATRSSSSTGGASLFSSKAATSAVPKPKAKAKPKEAGDSTKPKATLGIMKPTPISPALGSFLGVKESSRAEAVKQIWAHIKLHNLQALCVINHERVKYLQMRCEVELSNSTQIRLLLCLQNPANKREIYCDDKLKGIFEGREKVGFLEIGKLLSRHFVKAE